MLQKEKETFDKITIVTMLFNMGIDKLNHVKGTSRSTYYEYYVKSLITMADLFENIICFCDAECAKYLTEKELDRKICIVEMKFSELEKYDNLEEYEKIFDRMQKKLFFRQKIHYPRISRRTSCIVQNKPTPREIATYTILNFAKITFMKEAVKRNPYHTEYYYWMDAGCFQECYNMLWEKWDGNIMYRPQGIRVSLHAPRWSALRQKFLWTRENIAYCFIPDQMAAAAFGGDKESIIQFTKCFDDTVMEFMKHKLLSSEQGIITYMIKKYPKLFDVAFSYDGYTHMMDDIMNGASNGKDIRVER